MSEICGRHQLYLSALADGELTLVPEATRDHVSACEACAAEVSTHGLLGERLRDGLLHSTRPPLPGRSASRNRRRPALAAAAAVLVVGGSAGATWRVTHGDTDPVVIALSAAQASPVLQSTDPASIRAWCTQASDRAGPPVVLPNLSPVGARMDTSDGTRVVTVFYQSPADGRIAVSWLDAASSPPSRSRVEARSVSGSIVLVMQTPVGEAVVSGAGSVGALWISAAAIQTVTG